MAVSRVELQGLGALQEAYRQLAEKLRGEGLTAASRKRPLPAWPRTVGVVTSREAAALRDVLRTILRRDPFAHVVVSFTPVQGDGSAPEIAEALARIDALGVCQVILLVRGGGSVEDLWAFNREPVARAICACRVPVVTGVGHETDTTIADLVADRSCSTPTAAAEVVMPVRSEMRAAWLQREARLHRAMDTIVQALGRRLSRIEARITDPQPMIHRRAQRIDELSLRAERNLRDRLASSRRDIADLSARLESTSPRMRVRGQSARLDLLHARLDRAIERRIERTRQRFARTAARLGDLSPLAILSRGYAVVHDGAGHVVRSASEVSPGDRLAVRLGEGTIRVLVQTDQDR
jgi:exodeoxyribonuclease VII large subunit